MEGLLHGVAFGLVAALFCWLKNRGDDGKMEPFEAKWAVQTVAIGVVLGQLLGWDQKSLIDWQSWLTTVPVVVSGEVGVKILSRHGLSWLVGGIKALWSKVSVSPK